MAKKRDIKGKFIKQGNLVSDDIFIPNHSGVSTHPESIANFLRLDASNDPVTGDLRLSQDLIVDGDVLISNDNAQFQMGAAGATDFYQTFDGTDAQFYTSGDFIFTPSQSKLRVIEPANNRALTINANAISTNYGIVTDEDAYGQMGAFEGVFKMKANGRNLRLGSNSVSSIIELEYNTGNVGIGTTTPMAKLHIQGAAVTGDPQTNADDLVIEDLNNNVGISLLTSSGRNSAIYFGDQNDNDVGRLDYDHNVNTLKFRVNADDRMTIDSNGNVGIGTTAPTTKLSINEKAGISPIGGIMVKLTNKTGANSVAGQLVKASTGTNDAVDLTSADEEECVGVFLDTGVSDGSEAWVVVSGIADVAMEDNTAATRGNWVRTSVGEAGYADSTNASPPSPASFTHFNEIGHCIESVAAGGAGTHILARCILHFN